MTGIEDAYRKRTNASRALLMRAETSLPGGMSRSTGWHRPYPPVFEKGAGAYLWDVDGNKYVDLVNNAMSLIHGHAYPPVIEAVERNIRRGTAWPGTSPLQVEYAEYLCGRLASVDRLCFTNSGTEAAMLAVKVARRYTGRRLVVKAWDAYHGSYDVLESGLHGQGEVNGAALLARFNEPESFERVLDSHAHEIAAVIVEPVMCTGVVRPPDPGFLNAVQRLCRERNVLFVIDDCMMLRLALGGSAERFGLDPDLTILGKFIGGGFPMGALGGRAEIIDLIDPGASGAIHHGGSFNGNPIACVAGLITMRELTAARIATMEEQAHEIGAALRAAARDLAVELTLSQEGSVLGIYLRSSLPASASDTAGRDAADLFRLACLNRGVYLASDSKLSLNTCIADADLAEVVSALSAALVDYKREAVGSVV